MIATRALLPSLGFLATFGILVTNIVGQGVFLKGRAIACEVGTAGSEFFVCVPTGSVIGTSAIAVVLVSIMGFERLSDYNVFNSWSMLALVVVGLIVIRRRERTATRPYRVAPYPLVPIIYLGLLAYVLVATLLTSPTDAAIGLGIALCGFPAYVVVARLRRGRLGTTNAPLASDPT